MSSMIIRGVFSNMPTALTEDGRSIDTERMGAHVNWVIESGVNGVSCLLGSGGFTYLTGDERYQVAEAVIKAASGRVPVLIGITGESTAETVELGRAVDGLGATALMVQPRSFLPLTTAEVLAHYEAVAKAVTGPIGIYNHPQTTGYAISDRDYAEIVQRTGAIVTKDGGPDLFNVSAVTDTCRDLKMSYLSGAESLLFAAFLLGADGCCVAIASVFPQEVSDMYRKIQSGDVPGAKAVYLRMLPVLRAFKKISTPRAVKAAAELRGHSLGPQRAPVQDLNEADTALLKAAIAAVENQV